MNTPLALKLDGDDIVNPNYVSAAMQLMRRQADMAVVGGRLTGIHKDSFINAMPNHAAVTSGSFRVYSGLDALQFCLNWKPVPCSSSMLFRMEAYRRVNGFEKRLGWCPDREIWFRLARIGKIAVCDDTSSYYRTLDSSVTAKTIRSDRQCFEHSTMVRLAAAIWREPEAIPLLQNALVRTGGSLIKSAWRSSVSGRIGEAPTRLAKGAADLILAATLARSSRCA